MTLASGLHMGEPDKIMGSTPMAAAMVVRKMGRSRRLPASMAAVGISIFCLIISSLAKSTRIMELRTTMPDKLISPRKAVNPKGLWVMTRPRMAPNKLSGMLAITSRVSFRLRNWKSRIRKMSTMLMPRAIIIWANVVFWFSTSPPYSTR